jgi:DNA repair protein RecO (recombination protein O)
VSRGVRLQAFVLRTVDFGERDRVVSLLSRERGKLSAFARGARTSRRRFGGALEPFTRLRAELRERAGAELWTLEDVTVERGHGGIRADLARIACAGYACELAGALVRDAEPHEDLFDLVGDYLGRLDDGPARPWDLRAFELGALRATGLMPRLDACARCGQPPGGGPIRFDPAHGGVLCPACRGLSTPGGRDARAETIAALVAVQAGEEPGRDAGAGAEARDLLTLYLDHQLGRRLQARRFLDEMGPLLGG